MSTCCITVHDKRCRTVGIQIWCMQRFLVCESLPHCEWGGLYHVYFMIWSWEAIWSNLVALNARENIICFTNLSCWGPVHWIRVSSDAKVYWPVMGGRFSPVSPKPVSPKPDSPNLGKVHSTCSCSCFMEKNIVLRIILNYICSQNFLLLQFWAFATFLVCSITFYLFYSIRDSHVFLNAWKTCEARMP